MTYYSILFNNSNTIKLSKKTIFDKIWDNHVVCTLKGGTDVLYIDRHYIHEVTSPQAFEGLRLRGTGVFRPGRTTATADHNVPTKDQHLPLKDKLGREQLEKLEENCLEHGIMHFGLNTPYNGIVHVIGPELGITRPGMTIVCGDSHTSTHGAFGTIAFGIGTSEVEMVLASQAILQNRPGKMRINVEGIPGEGVTAKDMILHIISKVSTNGASGYFVEFAGSAIENLSMESRMAICNMSIEMGARGGIVAPDEVTFAYMKGRPYAPKGKDWDSALEFWKSLPTDNDAEFDMELFFKAKDVQPMVTWGTNPGMGTEITGKIPLERKIDCGSIASFRKALEYMNFSPGEKLEGKEIDYVFLGSCTNGRMEDFRAFASLVKGRRKSDRVTAWIVPGSKQVEKQCREEGITAILEEAGFEMRQPGCSACLAMNDDKVPEGKYAIATSNRNFEGRQGPGSRTILGSPLTAAAAAITGKLTDPRKI